VNAAPATLRAPEIIWPGGQGAGLAEGSGLGEDASLDEADGDGDVPGVSAGCGVGRAVGLGVAAGRHEETPLPATVVEAGGGAESASSGSVPAGGKSCATSARIAATSGIWMEPRTSKPGATSGCVITAR
jgi:hypothetical protein